MGLINNIRKSYNRASFYISKPPFIYTYESIKNNLYITTNKYYKCPIPLPFMHKYGEYKAGIVPKIFHFIWVGSPIPAKYRDNISNLMTINPNYKIILWVDCPSPGIRGVDLRLINKSEFINEPYCNVFNNIVIKADLIRLELVYKYGGIYSDVDVIAKKPLDDTFQKSFLCYEPHHYRDIGNGMFGLPAGDPLLCRCLQNFHIHMDWLKKNRSDLLESTANNIACIAGGAYIMANLLSFNNLKEMLFINQDYVISDTGFGFSHQTCDATWLPALKKASKLVK